MVPRDDGRGGDARILRGRAPGAGDRPSRAPRAGSAPGSRSPCRWPGAGGAAARAARGPPRRQLPAPADGARRGRRIKEGHLPLTSWFPYLGLGSPQFLHYQSLPSMTPGPSARSSIPTRCSAGPSTCCSPCGRSPSTGAPGCSGWAAGPPPGGRGGAVPRVVGRYRLRDQGLRLGGLRRVDPAVGLVDAPAGMGLHLSLAAVAARRLLGRALHHADGGAALRDGLPGLRAAGRLALHGPLGPVAAAGRAVAIGAAAALASAWVIYPLLPQSHWAARNQMLEGTGLENGYGARQILWWLVSGQLYDFNQRRLVPVITILVPWASWSASPAGARSWPAAPSWPSGSSRSS